MATEPTTIADVDALLDSAMEKRNQAVTYTAGGAGEAAGALTLAALADAILAAAMLQRVEADRVRARAVETDARMENLLAIVGAALGRVGPAPAPDLDAGLPSYALGDPNMRIVPGEVMDELIAGASDAIVALGPTHPTTKRLAAALKYPGAGVTITMAERPE